MNALDLLALTECDPFIVLPAVWDEDATRLSLDAAMGAVAARPYFSHAAR